MRCALRCAPFWLCCHSVVILLFCCVFFFFQNIFPTEKNDENKSFSGGRRTNKTIQGKVVCSRGAEKIQYWLGETTKLWNGANQEPVTRDVPTTKQDIEQKEELQREIERVTQVQTPQREIVVEDFFARLGQIETKMERQTTQMERQTELMQNILDSLDAVSNIESDTQSILEKENTESYTLQDIGRSVQEYTDFTKTLLYCAITWFTVWQVLCKTWKHVDKGTSPVPAGPTAAAPTAPVPTPTRPSLYKKTPDPFKME